MYTYSAKFVNGRAILEYLPVSKDVPPGVAIYKVRAQAKHAYARLMTDPRKSAADSNPEVTGPESETPWP